MAKKEKLIEAIDNLTNAVNILNDRLLPNATKPGEKSMDMADIMKYARMGKTIVDGLTAAKKS